MRHSNTDPEAADIVAKIEFVIHFVTLFILVNEYRKIGEEHNEKFNFLFLLAINCFLLIVDYLFYIAAYMQSSYLQGMEKLNFIFYYAPCIIYAITAVIFLSKIIIKNIINGGNSRNRISLLLIASVTVFYLYLSSIHYAYPVLSFNNILQIILLFTEFILFDVCIIGMIYANNRNAFLMLTGFITLVAGDFFLTYTYISQSITNYLIIGEFLWCLGLIFLFFTAISIRGNKEYSVTKWFRNDKAIKSRVSFHIYLISIISYLMVYFISHALGIINKPFLTLFPVLTMIYSIVIVILSIIVGKRFEEPFQVLQNNIQNFLTDKGKYNTTYKFDIEEFEYLQQFLIKVIEINDNHNQLYVSFGDIAVKAAHDLGSPLLSINSAINNIKDGKNDIGNLPALELSLTKVKEITNNLLVKYRTLTVNNTYSPKLLIDKNIDEPRYINIIKLIDELVICKNIEWQCEPCNIKIETHLEHNLYFFSPTKLSRILSNLLNNAYESLTAKKNDILISLSEKNMFLTLTIKDKGIGIAEERIKEVLSGVSFKHNGKGLGISSALEYMNSLNGNLLINSKVNYGTEVILEFPVSVRPDWLATNIYYTPETKFVVLDDDPSIHMQLQIKLKNLDITSYHFVDIDSYFNFINNLDNFENLVYLIDLNLEPSNLNGFEIINKSNLSNNQNVYLMTSDAEMLDIQNKVQLFEIKLIHKSILNAIQFCKVDFIQRYNIS